jgi:hypothetical protein
MGWVVNTTPRPPYPLGRPGTQCVGGWLSHGSVGIVPADISEKVFWPKHVANRDT